METAWDIAFRLARAGRMVFPLHHVNGSGCSCGRPDCNSAGKHPLTGHGVKDASRDETVLADWRAKWPDANIGLATGAESAVLVIDVDPRHGGDESLAALEAEHGPLPATVTVRTGSGGRHLYFRWPGHAEITIGVGLGGKPGLDWRGNGGYVVAPGSVHASGRAYEIIASGPDGLAECPAWLLALVEKPKRAPQRQLPPPRPAPADGGSSYGKAALDAEVAVVRATAEGGRNHRLNASAFSVGQLVAGGELARDVAEQALVDAGMAAGLSEREARSAATNGLEAGMKFPRVPPPRPAEPEAPACDDERPPDPEEPPPYARETIVDVPEEVAAAEEEPEEWEAPTPLNAGPRPAFPVDALPPWLATWVRAEAEATQTPEDLAAFMALAAVSAAVGRKFRIATSGGHEEPVNVYTLVVLPSGSRKSRVCSDACDPIEAYERILVRRGRDEIEAKKLERKALEATAAQLERDYSKAKNDAERDGIKVEIQNIAGQLLACEVPAMPRLLADDTTPERLAQLLSEQGGRMAIMSAEGGLFETLAGRYSKTGTGNIDIVLKAHSGENARVDRIGRPPIFIERACLTLGLAVQPDVLQGLASKEGFRGRGLCGRFLYSVPHSRLGERKSDSTPVPMEVSEIYANHMTGLLDLRPGRDEEGKDKEHVLTMSPAARGVFRAFQEEIEPHLAPYGELGHMTDWGGKLVGAVGRIAGLIHLARTPTCSRAEMENVSPETIEAAISIGRYLLAHARIAYSDMGAEEEVDDARYLLGYIRTKGLESFSQRDLHRALRRGRFSTVEPLSVACRILSEHGFIRAVKTEAPTGRGRPPSPSFEVSPFILTAAPAGE